MAGESGRTDSNGEILLELQKLSESLYRSEGASRQNASLVLPRSSNATPSSVGGPQVVDEAAAARMDHRSRSSRRLSLSPWRLRPKPQLEPDGDDSYDGPRHRRTPLSGKNHGSREAETVEKKGIWNWKPIRALAHVAMHRLACLFSVEVLTVEHLPASMNGLRLAVAFRKKETRDGAVQTMPSRVLDGSADFEETLSIRCHLYCTGGAGTGKPLKFEPRPFVIFALAVDAPELDFGKHTVDLSSLIRESIEKNFEGQRVRQWHKVFQLSGKAKGGEMVLNVAFQVMADRGIGIYNQSDAIRAANRGVIPTASSGMGSPLSIFSARTTGSEPTAASDSNVSPVTDMREMYMLFNQDDADSSLSSSPSVQNSKQEPGDEEDLDLPEFEVIDKGVEYEEQEEQEDETPKESTERAPASCEVVKEVVHDRVNEFDSIAWEMKNIERMMNGDEGMDAVKTNQDIMKRALDAEEEMVTRDFLQLLELEDGKHSVHDMVDHQTSPSKLSEEDKHSFHDMVDHQTSPSKLSEEDEYEESNEDMAFLSDLGKGVGPVVQTSDGGYLVSMNPFNVQVARKGTPKITMQISRLVILPDAKEASGFEIFQLLAAMGPEELSCKILSLVAMDELLDKTPEQISFEGVASAVINGRNEEGASSSAARSVAVVKKMAAAMNRGRRERILTGIWNAHQGLVTIDKILNCSLQRMEAVAIDALKVQSDIEDEEATFAVSPLIAKDDSSSSHLETILSPKDWTKTCSKDSKATLLTVVQLRDPLRSYEAVGAPMIALMQAAVSDDGQQDEDRKFKLTSLHIEGLKLRPGGMKISWDGEKQRLTATQWLVANGLARAGKRNKKLQTKKAHDLLWSISTRVMADMWLKPTRNPNVRVLGNNSVAANLFTL